MWEGLRKHGVIAVPADDSRFDDLVGGTQAARGTMMITTTLRELREEWVRIGTWKYIRTYSLISY